MYHNISEHAGFNTVAFSAFQNQINFIKNKYQIISTQEYVEELLRTGMNNPQHVVLTFDDGYVSYTEKVRPFLKANNLPSTVFICTNSIGKTNSWDMPPNRIAVMDEKMLKTLSAEHLTTIAAHSVTHRVLCKLPPNEVADELLQSKLLLETILEKPINYMAYPYGQIWKNINSGVMAAAKKAGYTAAFSTNFSTQNTRQNLFSLNRVEVVPEDTLDRFAAKLKKHSYYFYKQKVKNIVYYLKK